MSVPPLLGRRRVQPRVDATNAARWFSDHDLSQGGEGAVTTLASRVIAGSPTQTLIPQRPLAHCGAGVRR